MVRLIYFGGTKQSKLVIKFGSQGHRNQFAWKSSTRIKGMLKQIICIDTCRLYSPLLSHAITWFYIYCLQRIPETISEYYRRWLNAEELSVEIPSPRVFCLFIEPRSTPGWFWKIKVWLITDLSCGALVHERKQRLAMNCENFFISCLLKTFLRFVEFSPWNIHRMRFDHALFSSL